MFPKDQSIERCQVAEAMWQFRDASETSCQWGFHIPYLLQGLGKCATCGIYQHHIQDLSSIYWILYTQITL